MTHRASPEFVLYVGPMYSGKSSRVLLEAETHAYMGRAIKAFKPRIDDRFSSERIVTHNGMGGMDAKPVEKGKQIVDDLLAAECAPGATTVLVDEAFMIPGSGSSLVFLYRMGFHVMVSTLDMSSSFKPFDEVRDMLPWATRVEKCTAVCSTCRLPARFTWRKPSALTDEILVGGVETYEARCALCHPHFSEIGK